MCNHYNKRKSELERKGFPSGEKVVISADGLAGVGNTIIRTESGITYYADGSMSGEIGALDIPKGAPEWLEEAIKFRNRKQADEIAKQTSFFSDFASITFSYSKIDEAIKELYTFWNKNK